MTLNGSVKVIIIRASFMENRDYIVKDLLQIGQ